MPKGNYKSAICHLCGENEPYDHNELIWVCPCTVKARRANSKNRMDEALKMIEEKQELFKKPVKLAKAYSMGKENINKMLKELK